MTIYLVRHGMTELNKAGIRGGHEQDDKLTKAGRSQALMAAHELRPQCTDPLILHSPSWRARQTAWLIGPGLEVRWLRERIYDITHHQWSETCEQVAADAAKLLSRLTGDVIAVTHAGVIKGLMGLDKTPPNGSIHIWKATRD